MADDPMDPDEQAYGSIRYACRPIMVVELPSGRIAIGSGYNPFNLIEVAHTWEEAMLTIRQNALYRHPNAFVPAEPTTPLEGLPELDL